MEEIIINVDLVFNGMEGKSHDNIIFILTKILKDLEKMKNTSGFNVKIFIHKVEIDTFEPQPFSFKEIIKSFPISLN